MKDGQSKITVPENSFRFSVRWLIHVAAIPTSEKFSSERDNRARRAGGGVHWCDGGCGSRGHLIKTANMIGYWTRSPDQNIQYDLATEFYKAT